MLVLIDRLCLCCLSVRLPSGLVVTYFDACVDGCVVCCCLLFVLISCVWCVLVVCVAVCLGVVCVVDVVLMHVFLFVVVVR